MVKWRRPAIGQWRGCMTTEQLEQLTFAHIPEAFFGRLLRAVFAAHQVAFQDCRDTFAETEATNLRPYYRRAKLEGFMRDAADMVPGIVSTVVLGEGHWFHTELRSGPVVVTASSVPTPCAIVEGAEFRQTLARDNVRRLWPEPGDIPAEDAPLYALLLHSRSRWETKDEYREYGHLPGSAYIAYPTPDLGAYVHEINLFERFPHVVEAHMPQSWDDDAALRYVASARKARAA